MSAKGDLIVEVQVLEGGLFEEDSLGYVEGVQVTLDRQDGGCTALEGKSGD